MAAGKKKKKKERRENDPSSVFLHKNGISLVDRYFEVLFEYIAKQTFARMFRMQEKES